MIVDPIPVHGDDADLLSEEETGAEVELWCEHCYADTGQVREEDEDRSPDEAWRCLACRRVNRVEVVT